MTRLLLAACVSFAATAAAAQPPADRSLDSLYKLGPDSLEQEGVPKGKIVGPFTLKCEVYPGTQHTYWVYVPAQYDKEKPASLMVFQGFGSIPFLFSRGP